MSTKNPRCHYLPLRPWESLLSSPVVEMLSFSKLPDSTDPSAFEPLMEYIRKVEGCLNVIGAPTTQYGDGKDEKRFLIMIGWESIEAHERGKKPEGFAKLSDALWKKAEVHHVKWEKVEGAEGDGDVVRSRL
jgi:quinol monooxygenase YgiN